MREYNKISDGLNYNIDNVEDRLKLVEDLIEKNDKEITDYYDYHYNPHINQSGFLSESSKMGKDLESLANYLLYAKDAEPSDEIVTDYKKKRNSQREASIEKIIKVREHRRETAKSIFKVPKVKVSKKDRLVYKDLKQTGEVLDNLTKMIKTGKDSNGKHINPIEIRRLKWMRTDIQKDEVVMKTELKRYIKFQSITPVEKDMNALSYIRFDDIEIIRILIEEYNELKEYSSEDTFGYMKIILFAFDELMEYTDLKDYMKDVLAWKIEGVAYDDMIEMLQEKYDLKLTRPRLSKMTRETIPYAIVETYKNQKEEWVYTYVFKGVYKTCPSCEENLLATTKYFNPNKTAKSGLRSVCKSCRKRKYRLETKAVKKDKLKAS